MVARPISGERFQSVAASVKMRFATVARYAFLRAITGAATRKFLERPHRVVFRSMDLLRIAATHL